LIERELTLSQGLGERDKNIDESPAPSAECLVCFDESAREFSDEENLDETVLTVRLTERKNPVRATFGISSQP